MLDTRIGSMLEIILYPFILDTGRQRPIGRLQLISFFAKEPLISGLFYGKRPIKIRHPMGLHHPVPELAVVSHNRQQNWQSLVITDTKVGCYGAKHQNWLYTRDHSLSLYIGYQNRQSLVIIDTRIDCSDARYQN